MASYERRNDVEPTRGRRTPASNEEARHGDRDRSARQNNALSSRARSSRSRSPLKHSRSPDKAPPVPRSTTADANLAERRHNPRPAVIDIGTARQYGSVSKKAVVVESPSQNQSQHASILPPNTPPTPLRRVRRMMSPSMSAYGDDEGSSYYSEEESSQAHPSYVSPLRVHKGVDSDHNLVLRSYSAWGKTPSPELLPDRYPSSPQRSVVSHTFMIYFLLLCLYSL